MSPIQLASMIKISLLFVFFVSIHANPDGNISVEENSVKAIRTIVRLDQKLRMRCEVSGYNSADYVIVKLTDKKNETLSTPYKVVIINSNSSLIILTIDRITRKDNGTYQCRNAHGERTLAMNMIVIVIEKPIIKLEFVEPITADTVYLNWTVNDGNDPIKEYRFLYANMAVPPNWVYFTDAVYDDGRKSSHFLNTAGLKRGGEYKFRIVAKNSVGESSATHLESIILSEKDFVPKVNATKSTGDSVTIHWSTSEPLDLQGDYVYGVLETCEMARNLSINTLTINKETVGTNCRYKVRICSKYDDSSCGNWGDEAEVHEDEPSTGSRLSGMKIIGVISYILVIVQFNGLYI